MLKYIKEFANHTAYETYKNSEDYVRPNVSYCEQQNEVHYNWVETRLVCKFNITNTSSATPIMYSSATSQFSEIEIDGVIQPNVVASYIFDTKGEHTIKYTLINNTSIGVEAFYNCKTLTSVTIPNSVTSISSRAFCNCDQLTSITIPNSVTIIKTGVFYECSRLTSITIPDSMTIIESETFRGCSSLRSVIIPDSITTIKQGAFQECVALNSVSIGNSVTNIGRYAFEYCTQLRSIICNATTAPTIKDSTFASVPTNGILTVPIGSTGYNVWMGTGNFYLGKYNWTKVEQ